MVRTCVIVSLLIVPSIRVCVNCVYFNIHSKSAHSTISEGSKPSFLKYFMGAVRLPFMKPFPYNHEISFTES